jgi:Protein of unknown function (DUF3445)
MAIVENPHSSSHVAGKAAPVGGKVSCLYYNSVSTHILIMYECRYFHRMKVGDIVARHNFFLQTDDVLFQQVPFAETLPEPPKIEDIRIRHERQTLRRLPRTGAILFLVRTYIKPLTELRDEPDSLRAFLASVRAMPPNMAKYKGRQVWGEVVEGWCEDILGEPTA